MKPTAATLILLIGLSACSRYAVPSALPDSAASLKASGTSNFKVLMEFDRFNGCNPYAGVVPRRGTLYGTTKCGGRFGNGEIYSLSTTGKWHLVHSFTSDARDAYAPVTIVGKTLYGTSYGGKNLYGTVYSVGLDGKTNWVYDFKGAPDGYFPNALIYVNGTLYGTTYSGGTSKNCPYNLNGCGTVFKISTSGKESVIYSFQGINDGAAPQGGLVNVNGTLYGTTAYGGAPAPYRIGPGTVFSVTTSGVEKMLHVFGNGYDGNGPMGSLIFAKGLLYGTTESGGTARGGTVFSITTSGQENVVYSLGSQPNDGTNPQAGLAYLNGKLYGTASQGGSNCAVSAGCGSVFEVTPSGQEQVLHSFGGGQDGSTPHSQLAAVNGVLYGTAESGGSYYNYGTAFSVTP